MADNKESDSSENRDKPSQDNDDYLIDGVEGTDAESKFNEKGNTGPAEGQITEADQLTTGTKTNETKGEKDKKLDFTSDKGVSVTCQSESKINQHNRSETKDGNFKEELVSETGRESFLEESTNETKGRNFKEELAPEIERKNFKQESSPEIERENFKEECSEKQNLLNQHNKNGISLTDREIVERIVKEEISKHKRHTFIMQTGISALIAFFVGVGLMYFRTPVHTNTTISNPNNSNPDMDGMTAQLLQCQANLTQIKQDLSHLKEDITKDINGDIKNVKEELKDDFLNLKRDVTILSGTQQIQDHKYITYSESLLFLLAGLIIEPLIILLFVYKYYYWRNGGHGDQNVAAVKSQPRRVAILDQIHSQKLEESVCILSFYGETQKLHQRIITSALQKDIPLKPFFLQSTDPDVLSIPRCHFIFVFVDYNERNVILENPGQDLGDKKLVTVQACQKMGADVFVIYTRDKGSNHLHDGKLYNPDLSAFTKHNLLKQLTSRDRGLSVNETFTDYQKSHIKKVVLGN